MLPEPLPEPLYTLLDPSLDRYLNPFIPPNFLSALPKSLSRFLGHRSNPPPKDAPALIQWTLTILATIAGISTVGAVYNYAPGITQWNPPPIIASLGASAILYYNAVGSPLGQPRNAIVGHTLAALVGTAVAKLFLLDPVFFTTYNWLVSAVACAAAGLAMSATNTVHPPGGATAILACADQQIMALGWMFPPLILLASVLMLVVALVMNNTFRRYPTSWWTPAETGSKLPLPSKRKKRREESMAEGGGGGDLEKAGRKQSQHSSESLQSSDGADSERTLGVEAGLEIWHRDGLDAIHIAPHRITMPTHVAVNEEEARMLRSLMRRLGTNLEMQLSYSR